MSVSVVPEIENRGFDAIARPAALVALTAALAFNLLRLVDLFAVNLLFNDQWGIYDLLGKNVSWWQLFRTHRGPHRQGVGYLITRYVAEHSAWNTRAEAFSIAVLLIIAAILALLVRWRMAGKLDLSDAVIPLIVLTTAQYDTLVLVPNPSHSAAPLLLVFAMALVVLAPKPRSGVSVVQFAAILLLEFVTIHTGFGLFAGFVIAAVTAVHAVRMFRQRDRRWKPAVAAFATSVAVLATFFVNYHPQSGAGCFSLFGPKWPFYFSFVSLMFGAFCGFLLGLRPYVGATMSTAIVLALFVLFARAVARLLRSRSLVDDRQSLVTVSLFTFSLLFAGATALGRVCVSPAYGQSSRYMTLLIPAFVAAYFELSTFTRRVQRATATLALALLVVHGYLPFTPPSDSPIARQAAAKRAWVACYRKTLDRSLCDETTHTHVIEEPWERSLDERLRYLREHRLNIFAEP